ncbi:MAG TPA: hypothetical protein GX504_05655 [Clostridia bacterium]|nr:hypothetical protein [Clostridia bacterium]
MIKVWTKFRQHEQGFVLPLALVLLAAITLLGFSAVFLASNQQTLGQRIASNEKALHYAEAGIHAYLGHVNKRQNVEWTDWDIPIPFEDGFYRLEKVENEGEKATSLVRRIRSTGWVKGHEESARTIEVEIGRVAFNQYSMFSGTDKDIVWTTGEKCYGPYHTNETLNINGDPVFYGPVTYATGLNIERGSPTFKQGHKQVPPIEVPESNYQLKERAAEGGHVYYGRTRILLTGSSYKVKYFNEKGQEVLETKPLPENGVIYIDAGKGQVKNYNNKFDQNLGNLFIAGELSGNLTIGAANDIYITGYDPTVDQWNTAKNQPKPSSSQQGLVYRNTTFYPVDGNGNPTNNDNKVVGFNADTTKGDDLLGLVANNKIRILGRGWFNNPNPDAWWLLGVWIGDPEFDVAPENITIHGAVFSINEGFGYESYEVHKKGTITLRGSLIQKTRQPVGKVNGTGYTKNYGHDPRMLEASPPHFPEPLNTGWEIKKWIVDPVETR